MNPTSNPHARTRSIRRGKRTSGPSCLELELFADLAASELAALSRVFVSQSFRAGEVLMRQGEPGDELFLLEYGTVQIEVEEASRANFVRTVEAPAALGEMALLTNDPRTATVRALDDVRCLQVDRPRFEAMITRRPELAQVLTRLLGERLKEIDGIRTVGKYTVTGVLGAGAVARVFSAEHPDLKLPVALKMLSHSVVHHPQFANAFDEEARIIARLAHPNVVRVFDTAEAYGTRFIVMELLEGQMLEDRIGSRQPLDFPRIRHILIEMCHALGHVHDNGLVHRDVKPDNIFLTADGPAKLLDFGIAIRRERSICTGDSRLGTPFYMPPEQILGWSLDGRADLYALGVTAYEMASRRVPYDAPDLESLLRKHIEAPVPDLKAALPQTPDWLDAFVSRCLQKHPDGRFRSAAEAAAFLEAAEVGEGARRVLRFDAHDATAVDAALRRALRELSLDGIAVELAEG